MIELAGSARRSYRFPAPLSRAFAFHRDLVSAIGLLRHIRIVETLGRDRFRLCYEATEAGLYRVRILCDVRTIVDGEHHTVRIEPLVDGPASEATAGLHSMTGWGSYSSSIGFSPEANATRITYALSIQASLPLAWSLRMLPRRRVASAADRILARRIDEIVDAFAIDSIAAFDRVHTESSHR